jgi:hypothetical protein
MNCVVECCQFQPAFSRSAFIWNAFLACLLGSQLWSGTATAADPVLAANENRTSTETYRKSDSSRRPDGIEAQAGFFFIQISDAHVYDQK